ncbi:hypothetical protein J132_10241 [Termitomyces sp. J132]|nr:hypothetical protein J132_10241 [Termitomyces sp. J132]
MLAHISCRYAIEEPDVLPTRPIVFVGRSDLVQSATDALLKFHHVALIGPGGIGKSSIARAVLNDGLIVSTFKARRYFVQFDNINVNQVNLKTFLDHILRALGFATPLVNAYNLITKTLSTAETLLVLDNAETFLDATMDAGQIADAIDGFGARSNVAILLTTRTTVIPPNLKWVRLRVPPLEESAACEAFQAYHPSIETSILIKLLSAVDFHPLSINLLAQAAVQNEWSPQDLITAWDHQHATLLEAGNGKSQSLAVTIETSLNSPSFLKLGETVHHLLQIIAFLPQGISKTHLTAIFPRISNIETCAVALCRQSVAYLNGDFITLLAPVRLYISNHYNQNSPLLRGVQSYYAAHIRESHIVIAEYVNIEHVLIHWLRDTKEDTETICSGLKTASDFLYILLNHAPHSVSLYPVISALDVHNTHNSRSWINFFMQRQESKILLRSKSICLFNISYLMHFVGQVEEAKKPYKEAQTLALEVGDLDLLVFNNWILAGNYRWQGNYLLAEELLQTALRYCSSLSGMFRLSQKTKKKIKLEMMAINLIRGRPGTLQSYTESLPTLKQKYKQYELLKINFYAGFLALHNNHLEIARKYFTEMQTSDDEDDQHRWRKSIILAELAALEGNYAKSKELQSQMLEFVEKIPDQRKLNIMIIKARLAGYLAKEGNVQHARELINPLIEYSTKNLSLKVINFKYLAGIVELAGEDFDIAANYFNESIEDCISLAELRYCARSHRALGEIAVVKGDFTAARKHFEITTELCKTMGLPIERLYYTYTCYIPSERFDGWSLYKEGNDMFKVGE